MDLGQQPQIVDGDKPGAGPRRAVPASGGVPYTVRTDQVMEPSTAHQFTPGQQVTVKVDPDDPQCLLIWGAAQAPTTPPAPAEDRVALLAKLNELWTAGVLSDEEFQARKARMLAE